MKANEIRIGNLFHHAKQILFHHAKQILTVSGIGSITSLNQQFIQIEESTAIIEISQGLDPIPLTEEWFLKLGFIKEAHQYFDEEIDEEYEEIEFFIKTESGIEISSDDKGVKAYTDNCDGEVIPLTHIKHVHQLQNLFHALTGEELIIKP